MKKNKILVLFCVVNLFFSIQVSNAQWEACNNGIEDLNITAITKLKNDLFVGTWYGKLYKSVDNGNNWILKNSGLREWTIKSFATKGDSLFTSCGGVFLTTDKGDSWTNKGIPGFDSHLTINDDIIFAGTEGYYVQKSTNFGEKWSIISTGLTDNYIYSSVVNDNQVYVGTETGGIYSLDENGYSWTQLVSGEEIPNVLAIAANKNFIFAGSHGNANKGLFVSTNYGESWTKNGELMDLRVNSIVIENNNIYLGTDDGFFMSTDFGSSCRQKNLGLPETYVTSIALDSVNIFIGTGKGVYRAKISDLITDVETEKIENYNIKIYPNPASSILNLMIDNILSIDISQIKIYSGLGNEIELPNPLISEKNIQLDVSSLPQGVYYIRYINNGKFERAKFVKM